MIITEKEDLKLLRSGLIREANAHRLGLVVFSKTQEDQEACRKAQNRCMELADKIEEELNDDGKPCWE